MASIVTNAGRREMERLLRRHRFRSIDGGEEARCIRRGCNAEPAYRPILDGPCEGKPTLGERIEAWLQSWRCGWCHGVVLSRGICRPCAPKVLAHLKTVEDQRNAYSSSLFAATDKVTQLDRDLTTARKLLTEAAEGFRRGRLGRPVSNRIVAFLDGEVA